MYSVCVVGISVGKEVAEDSEGSLLFEVESLLVRFESPDHLYNATGHGTIVKGRVVVEEVRFSVEETLETAIDPAKLDGLDTLLLSWARTGLDDSTERSRRLPGCRRRTFVELRVLIVAVRVVQRARRTSTPRVVVIRGRQQFFLHVVLLRGIRELVAKFGPFDMDWAAWPPLCITVSTVRVVYLNERGGIEGETDVAASVCGTNMGQP